MRFLRYLSFALLIPLLSSCLSRGDSLAPIITIVDPPNGATRGLESPLVSGYALDDNGILSIKIDNTDLLTSEVYRDQKGKKLVQFFFQVTPSDNQFVATIIAEDNSGNIQTLPYELKIDTLPPTVEMSAEVIAASRLRVSGVARDNDAVKNIIVEGVAQAFLPSAEQSFSVDVTAGNTATVIIEDRAGNQISQQVTAQ